MFITLPGLISNCDQIKINTLSFLNMIVSPTATGVSFPGLRGAFDASRTPRRYSFLHQMQFVNWSNKCFWYLALLVRAWIVLTSKLVAGGEQIFEKRSTEISMSSFFHWNDNLTRLHRCFIKCSSPKVFRLRVSLFVGTRPSFPFRALVTHGSWLPLSNNIFYWDLVRVVCSLSMKPTSAHSFSVKVYQ